jgi:hypothetical protein
MTLRFAKKIMLAISIVFIVIQFIQPAHNKGGQLLVSDISKAVNISDSVQTILINACYDCHSNNTNYPWYVYIQPTGWFMAKHIKNGKEELNFSEFGSYSPRRQISKLDGIANSIKDDIMPLSSYKLMHKSAQFTTNEKKLLINWAQQSKDSLSTKN